MGIRTNCPQCGQKLNLKAHLAGKVGVCPQCQAKFRIPELPAGTSATESGIDLPPSLAPKPEAQSAAPAQPAQAPAAQAATAGQPAPAAPGTTQASVGTPQQANTSVATAVPAAQGVPAAQVPQSATPGAVPVAGTPVAGTPAATSVTGTPAPAAVVAQQATPVAGQSAAGPDPLNEAPEAVWYVRPPNGGQYGPAKADVMRGWIKEGRVTADCLVWREGWGDWKRADVTFPSLGKGPAVASAAVAVAPQAAVPQAGVPQAAVPQVGVAHPVGPQAGVAVSADSFGIPSVGTSSTGRPLTYRRRNKTGRVVGITVLIVAALCLLPLLWYVLQQQ